MLPPAIIKVTLIITSNMPMARRGVSCSLNISMAIATAVTGSTAPRIATGVLPIFCMAELVQISDTAVGNSAMQKADTHSNGLSQSIVNVLIWNRKANRNRPKMIT